MNTTGLIAPNQQLGGDYMPPPSFSGDKLPKGYKARQMQNYTPEQMQLFNQMFGYVSPESYLGQMAQGNQGFFDQMEAPALRQYQQSIGNLSSRFSAGSGSRSLGGRHSSGFLNTATSGLSNLAQDLASRRQALQNQAIMELMGLSNQLLGQRPYERFLQEKEEKPALGGWGPVVGGIAGGLGGAFFGMPTEGAMLGATALSGL